MDAKQTVKTVAAILPVALVVVFGLIQLVPYGRSHTNPPVVTQPIWNTPETLALAKRACFDCHSNETKWPWYASVAPMSWMVQDHVDEGRAVLNFSEWNRPYEEAEECAEVVAEGEMPMPAYLWLHPEARLTAAEKETLMAGFRISIQRYDVRNVDGGAGVGVPGPGAVRHRSTEEAGEASEVGERGEARERREARGDE
jgi:hypothetical protein